MELVFSPLGVISVTKICTFFLFYPSVLSNLKTCMNNSNSKFPSETDMFEL